MSEIQALCVGELLPRCEVSHYEWSCTSTVLCQACSPRGTKHDKRNRACHLIGECHATLQTYFDVLTSLKMPTTTSHMSFIPAMNTFFFV